MNEIWKPIKGYDGLYEVSNKGRVKSFHHDDNGIILKPYKDPTNGYMYINLIKSGKLYHRRVHRIVYSAFNPGTIQDGYDKRVTIDHLDGDKTNNSLENLELCTQQENNNRADERTFNKRSSKTVIDLDTGIEYIGAINAAKSLGYKSSNPVRKVCDGIQEKCKGHRFAWGQL